MKMLHLLLVFSYASLVTSSSFDVEKFKDRLQEPNRKFLASMEKFKKLKEEGAVTATLRRLRDLTRRLSGNDKFYYESQYFDDSCDVPYMYNAQPAGTCLGSQTMIECGSTTVTEYTYDFGSECTGTATEDSRELEQTCTTNGTESCGNAPSVTLEGEITLHLNDASCGSDTALSVMAFVSGCQTGTDNDGTTQSAEVSCENNEITMSAFVGSSCSVDPEMEMNFNEIILGNITDDGTGCVEMMNFFGITLHMKTTCEASVFVSEDDDDDDDDAVCFSGDDVLTLETGDLVRFSEVKVGDRILSATKDGAFSFSDVVFLPHGSNQKKATFVEMTTSGNKQLHATKSHLMVTCEGKTAAAGTLVPGACLRTVDGDETLQTMKLVQKYGIYTAVTDNDYIVVEGVVASPFAINHDLVDAYYGIHRFVYDNFPALLKSTYVARANDWLGQISATVYVALLGKGL